MSERLRWLLLIGVLALSNNGQAQRLGLLPPYIKWHQLVHDSLRIIFPEGYEPVARRTASLMLHVANADPISAQCRYKPISVLLQPQTNISNGYVGLAPYRSEFYLQPHENPFRLGSLPWTELLAIHETRHVQQLNAANTGISHLIKKVFGDYVFTGAYNLSIPNWYREGDAVYAETKYTRQGRGRLSLFTLPFREKMKSGKPWPYYLVRNGSYRQFTPDHYPLGYLIVQYGNQIFGEATWDTIVKRAPRFENLFSPFSGVVREKFGFRNKHMYDEAMQWFGEKWTSEETADILYEPVPLHPRDQKQDYLDIQYPVVEGDGSILAAVTTFDKTTAICRIMPDGRRIRLVSTGLQQDPWFHCREGNYVWTELRFDPRWIRKDQNVIVVWNEKSGHQFSIKTNKGYFTPSLDVTGKRIAALHADRQGQYRIHILDAETGLLLDSLPNPDNLYLGYPTFTPEGDAVIATARNKEGRMCLVEQKIGTGAIRQITHYAFSVLGRPVVHGDWILLTTGIDRLDQVFAVDRREGIFYKVSDGNKAHYHPAWDPVRDEIVCTEYHLDGHKLVRLPGQPHQWRMINLDDGVKAVAGASDRDLITEPLSPRQFDVRPYSPWFNAVNVHSWTLTADDPVWGAQVRSDNIMTSISMAAGYEYNRNTHASGPYLDVRLGMWFPEITFGVASTSREIETSDGREFRAINDRINAGLSLPLIFTPGVCQQALLISSQYNAGISRLHPAYPGIDDLAFNYLTHRLLLISSRNRAYRQALPTWGQRLDLSYAHEVTGTPISQLYAAMDLALPAVQPTHYIILQAEYLSQDIREGSIQLSSRYAGARGFDFSEGRHQYRLGFTYGFPLLYPDIGFGNILYTRRIRLQPFYDWAMTGHEEDMTQHMRSMGAELIIDFDFPPLSVGFRYSRLLEGQSGSPNRFEFFIPSQRF